MIPKEISTDIDRYLETRTTLYNPIAMSLIIKDACHQTSPHCFSKIKDDTLRQQTLLHVYKQYASSVLALQEALIVFFENKNTEWVSPKLHALYLQVIELAPTDFSEIYTEILDELVAMRRAELAAEKPQA